MYKFSIIYDSKSWKPLKHPSVENKIKHTMTTSYKELEYHQDGKNVFHLLSWECKIVKAGGKTTCSE